MPEPIEMSRKVVKVGYTTTEFWATVLTSVGAVAAQIAGFLPDPWGAVVAGISTAAYAISRGLAKQG